jgi:hypothetical protein
MGRIAQLSKPDAIRARSATEFVKDFITAQRRRRRVEGCSPAISDGDPRPIVVIQGAAVAATKLLHTRRSCIARHFFEGRTAALWTPLTFAHFGSNAAVGSHFRRRLRQTASCEPDRTGCRSIPERAAPVASHSADVVLGNCPRSHLALGTWHLALGQKQAGNERTVDPVFGTFRNEFRKVLDRFRTSMPIVWQVGLVNQDRRNRP